MTRITLAVALTLAALGVVFYVATGFSGHGFALGPAAGELVADMVMDTKPMMDPSPYRLSRFTDGSFIKTPEMM